MYIVQFTLRSHSVTSGHTTMSLEFDLEGDSIIIGFATDTAGGDWAVVDQVELGKY